MSQPIRQKAYVDPSAYRDDAALFRTSIVSVTVNVTPQRRKTLQGDHMLRGFIGEKEIEVVIPANRQKDVAPLLKLLQTRVQSLRAEASKKPDLSAVGSLRQKVRIDGVWRVRVFTDSDGMPERRFQLVAARWRYRGADGVDTMFGHLPSE